MSWYAREWIGRFRIGSNMQMVKVENDLVEDCTSQGFEKGKDTCRPCTSWLDGVKKACRAKTLELCDKTVT